MSHFDEELEIEVTVSQTLTKTDSVWTANWHEVTERDYDATAGGYVYTAWREHDDDIDVLFRQQHRLPLDIIRDCEKICEQLKRDGHSVYAGIRIADLSIDCDDWEEAKDCAENANVNKNDDLIEFL